MKIQHIPLTIVLLCSLFGGARASGQDEGPQASSEQADRALLYRLTRQVRRIDRETETLMSQAMAEARRNDGKADAATKARLLSARDERDRLFSRMLILSMRHGWEIPDLDRSTVTTSSREEAVNSVFGSIDVLVQRRFAAEARRIAARVRLPLVSLESMSR
jgi:hypothetical protein